MPRGVYIRKPFSEEHKKKIGLASRGRKYSKARNKKISRALKGHEISKETKLKMSKSLRGKFEGSKNPRWKNGKFKRLNGYISVHNPTHPNANKQGRMPEHVLVMSNYLRRPLTKDETVHHLNGIKDDNRLENLELWTSRHPSGQRVKDMIKFCKEYLKQYERKKIKSS